MLHSLVAALYGGRGTSMSVPTGCANDRLFYGQLCPRLFSIFTCHGACLACSAIAGGFCFSLSRSRMSYVCASASFFSCAAFQLESPRHEGLPSKKNTHLPVAVSLRAKERMKKPRNREQKGGGLEVEAGASGAVGRARGEVPTNWFFGWNDDDE